MEQVQGLRLVLVSAQDDELFRTRNELIVTEHPLKDNRLVGRQLCYLIGSDHGWLGAIGFGSCALRLGVREEWIGWDASTRKNFQDRVVNMTRLLIRPQVRCQNLASRVLRLCLDRVSNDVATLRAICIDAVIAWRLMLLTLLGREIPEMPCELMFSTWECMTIG